MEKKISTPQRDVMVVLKFVVTFILNKISPIMQEQNTVGLCRDYALGIFRNLSRPNIERKKKFGLPFTVTIIVTSANYLDVNLDLTKGI